MLTLAILLALEQRVIDGEFRSGACCIDSMGVQIVPKNGQWFCEVESADTFEGTTYIDFGGMIQCIEDRDGLGFVAEGAESDYYARGRVLVLQA